MFWRAAMTVALRAIAGFVASMSLLSLFFGEAWLTGWVKALVLGWSNQMALLSQFLTSNLPFAVYELGLNTAVICLITAGAMLRAGMEERHVERHVRIGLFLYWFTTAPVALHDFGDFSWWFIYVPLALAALSIYLFALREGIWIVSWLAALILLSITQSIASLLPNAPSTGA